MIDLSALTKALEAHAKVIRLVVVGAKGSTPRDIGTSMLICDEGHEGTIGGGRLELDAIKTARSLLDDNRTSHTDQMSLGPHLGQCCGGAVTLVFERFDAQKLAQALSASTTSYARQVETGPAQMPKALRTHIKRAQSTGRPPALKMAEGWLVEPTVQDRLPIYIYGAGHVGRALALCLTSLPQFEVHLSDVREEQFEGLPDSIWQSWELLPTDVLAHAPDYAAHYIMTPEHEYDLELCHRLLSRSFGFAGLIGSETKWARFRSRLRALGHADPQIERIQCPIGDPTLGKHPHAIAIGAAAHLIKHQACQNYLQRSTA
mgnify:CR=1 FL=1